MNTFLKKISVIVLVLIIISAVMVITAYATKKRILRYNISPNSHIVFVGNSQFETAINDSMLVGASNVAKSAKQYMMMRIDIENLLDVNPQIDTVFLVVSPFSLRETDADRSYEDATYLESITYYAPYMSIADYEELPNAKPFVKDLLFGGCLRYIVNSQPCGAYMFNTRDDMAADKKKHARAKNDNVDAVHNGNKITQHQLALISDICKKAGVKLIYISTPNWDAKNVYDLKYFRKQVAQLQRSSGADYWDYVDYQLPDTCFSDMTHLNWRGAKVFTSLLKKRLETKE